MSVSCLYSSHSFPLWIDHIYDISKQIVSKTTENTEWHQQAANTALLHLHSNHTHVFLPYRRRSWTMKNVSPRARQSGPKYSLWSGISVTLDCPSVCTAANAAKTRAADIAAGHRPTSSEVTRTHKTRCNPGIRNLPLVQTQQSSATPVEPDCSDDTFSSATTVTSLLPNVLACQRVTGG